MTLTLLFFCNHILGILLSQIVKMRPPQQHQHDPEEGTYSQVAIFQSFAQSNLRAWILVAAFEEEEDSDEKRGQKLRASKKLPQLVNYGSHHDAQGNCDECAICLEDFKAGQFCQVFPVCRHSFHSDCIDQWLQKKLTCPICRIGI
ncbi:hypothetical protein RIF29_31018 [Crotalaria pallida]|uniref:RING-type domain-containing protein n=1 Tax=Crotalaria pallida TaxID=3830 RepID=A0AAN9HXB5_CROPI